MVKRDPNKTSRSVAIKRMQEQLREILPNVLEELNLDKESRLNAFIGGKSGEFINMREAVIKSPQEYISKWVEGLNMILKNKPDNRHKKMDAILRNKRFQYFKKYLYIFLTRFFLKHYDEHTKTKPRDNESNYWFGVNDAHFGIYITPRYNNKINYWGNDKSEIRAFPHLYWSLGHILNTGLCYPGENMTRTFSNMDELLQFLRDQVRLTKSKYQMHFVDRYIDYVKSSENPKNIPFLIPEMRFGEDGRKHTFRLDFLIINPYNMEKIGIEISPWSSHGHLTIKDKKASEINEEAKETFESYMKKLRLYWKKYNIPILVFTDEDVKNMNDVFNEIIDYLNPNKPPESIKLDVITQYFEEI